MKSVERHGAKLAFNIFSYIFLTLIAVVCTLPFVMVITGSFTENSDIIRYGYSLFPKHWSLEAYKSIFRFPEAIVRSYGVSILVTAVGTVLGLLIMSMCGYALQRRELRHANGITFFIYFTTLFSGGMVPWYMLITGMGMKDSLWALILPSMCSSFYILLTRNFMRQLPESLVESAKIDGAGDFKIFWRIVIPLSTPVIATIGLFLGLGYWNNWYNASLFIKDVTKWPLQYRLYSILSEQMAIVSMGAENAASGASAPTEAVKLANAVLSTGPILLLYPFLQRYFVQGITIGAVKG